MIKSILFVLLMHAGTEVKPVAVFESLEQCRAAEMRASNNVAAAYKCAPADVAGNWTRKSSQYVVQR